MMKLATGIPHLRADANTRYDETNWHVYLDGEYTRFWEGNLAGARAFYADCTLISIQGNTLSFEAPLR